MRMMINRKVDNNKGRLVRLSRGKWLIAKCLMEALDGSGCRREEEE
jgi:hypothetical protein